MPGDEALKNIAQDVQSMCPEIGQYSVYNRRRKHKPIKKIDKMALLQKFTPFLKLVLPIARNGCTNHAICVVDDLVYDACVDHALKLKMETLDWICGKGGCDNLGPVYCFDKAQINELKKSQTNTTQSTH